MKSFHGYMFCIPALCSTTWAFTPRKMQLCPKEVIHAKKEALSKEDAIPRSEKMRGRGQRNGYQIHSPAEEKKLRPRESYKCFKGVRWIDPELKRDE